MSLITQKISSGVKTTIGFFRKSYQHSFTKRMNDKIISSAIKSSQKSVICRTLSSEPSTNKKLSEGVICNALYKLGRFLFTPFRHMGHLVSETFVFKSFTSFLAKIADFPLKAYGVFLCVFSLISLLLTFVNNYSEINIIFCGICLAVGGVLYIIKDSLRNIVSASYFCNLIKNIFTQDFSPRTASKHPAITMNRCLYVIFIIFGAIFGCISIFITPVLSLVLAVGIIGVGMCFKNFRIGAYAVILLFPFLPTMIIVGLLLISFISLMLNTAFAENFKFRKTNMDIYLILFAFVIFMSGVTSFDPASSINIALVYLVFISSYFVYTNSITSKKELYVAMIMLITSGTLVSLYGIYQYLFGFAEGSVWIDTGMFEDISTRVVSTFENPNVLGEYLLLIIPIILAFLFSSKKCLAKLSLLSVLAISVLCMVFTFSRGCWIGLIIAFIILSIFYDRRFLWAGIILVLFAPVYLPESVIQRFLSVGDTADTSTSYRVYIWFGTIDMLKDYWLTGIGLGEGAFNIIYPHYSYSAIVAPHSHNLYLQIIAENGIVGMIVFVTIIFMFYKNAISSLKGIKKGFLKTALLCLVSAMTGYLVQGLFDNVWYNYRIVMFFFMTLAITTQCAKIALKSDFKKEGETDA